MENWFFFSLSPHDDHSIAVLQLQRNHDVLSGVYFSVGSSWINLNINELEQTHRASQHQSRDGHRFQML